MGPIEDGLTVSTSRATGLVVSSRELEKPKQVGGPALLCGLIDNPIRHATIKQIADN
jgi:hypothetical protein